MPSSKLPSAKRVGFQGELGAFSEEAVYELVPEAAKLAQYIRKNIVNPGRDQLIELGMLDVDVRDMPNYLTRIYRWEYIRRSKGGGAKRGSLYSLNMISVIRYNVSFPTKSERVNGPIG